MARSRRARLVGSGSRRCRSSSSSLCLLALFMYHRAAGLPAALHLHDLPLDAAAADPARGRPHLRHRRRRDRPLLPGDHRLLRLRLRRALQGVRPRLDRGRRRPRLGAPRRLRQRRPRRQDRHPLLHGDARHAVLLGRHGDRALGRQVLRAARRRGELGLAGDRRPPLRRLRDDLDRAAADAGALDGDHRRLPLVHPQPPPLRRARALHRRFERRLARRRHRRRAREDQASSR